MHPTTPWMWRVAPNELAFLRAENVRLAAENVSGVDGAQPFWSSLILDLYRSVFFSRSRRSFSIHLEWNRRSSSLEATLSSSLPTRDARYRQRIEQLENGIVALQEANHFKEMQILRLRQEVEAAKASVILQDLMRNPCLLSTGQLYNRDSVLEWLWRSRSNRCPNT